MAAITDLSGWVLPRDFVFDCPECGTRNMRMYKDDPRTQLSAEGLRRIAAEGHRDDYLIESDGVFVATFECRAGTCRQNVAVSGEWQRWVNDGDDQSLGPFVTVYKTRFVWPPVLLFPMPSATPPSVAAAVTSASTVAWADPAFAAAGLRSAVERLLDHEGRPPLRPLDHRIELAREDPRLEGVVDLLLATKWIGNMGAHENVSIDDVLASARVLEEALRFLYDQSSTETRQLAADINRRKGRPE